MSDNVYNILIIVCEVLIHVWNETVANLFESNLYVFSFKECFSKEFVRMSWKLNITGNKTEKEVKCKAHYWYSNAYAQSSYLRAKVFDPRVYKMHSILLISLNCWFYPECWRLFLVRADHRSLGDYKLLLHRGNSSKNIVHSIKHLHHLTGYKKGKL